MYGRTQLGAEATSSKPQLGDEAISYNTASVKRFGRGEELVEKCKQRRRTVVHFYEDAPENTSRDTGSICLTRMQNIGQTTQVRRESLARRSLPLETVARCQA